MNTMFQIAGGVLILCCGGSLLLGQGKSIKDGGVLIGDTDLPSDISKRLDLVGSPFRTSDKAQVVLTGTIVDSNGRRQAQIQIQASGRLTYSEGGSKVVAFNGNQFTGGNSLSTNEEAIMESLVAHSPSVMFLEIARGATLQRIGSHFRADGSKGAGYRGPYYTVYAFSPVGRPAVSKGGALQQNLFLAFDESTGFLSEVRLVAPRPSTNVVQTQFSNWTESNGQKYPATITRLESGRQVLQFTVEQISIGSDAAVAATQQ